MVKKILGAQSQPLTASRIIAELHNQGFINVDKSEVNSYLYMAHCNGTVRKVDIEGIKAPGWLITETSKRQLGLVPPSTREPEHPDTKALGFTLYRWQADALIKWQTERHRGMIEAVTGTGKTRLAFAAWDQLWKTIKPKPLNTLVVVPTIPLMNQWCESFQELFPDRRIGRIGGGFRDDYSRAPICVAVIKSAVNRVDRLLAHCRSGPTKSFLIADECHRYVDAPVFGEIRCFPFDHVMALSATVGQFMVPGFGHIIYTYSFADAVRDGLVPHFDLVNLTIPLTADEREDYDDLTKEIGDQIEYVKMVFETEIEGLTGDYFWRKLKQLIKKPDGTEEESIKRLFGLLFRRTKIVYTARYKMRLAKEISQLLLNEGRKKLIAFFERIQSAEDVQEQLAVETAEELRQSLAAASPFWCRVLHSGLDQADRRTVLDEFRANGVSALLACRVLDEGLDVPQIDAALLVASTQSRRQRIQRIGRALRRGDGGKRPLIVTLHVPGTSDENVTADDRDLFDDAATIYSVAGHDCIETLKALLHSPSK